EGGARIRRVVQNAAAIDDVERALLQAGPSKVRLDEEDALDAEAIGGIGGEFQRGPGQVRADDQPTPLGQAQAHLAGAAPDLDDSRIESDGFVEEADEFIAKEPRTDVGYRLARRVPGKRSDGVKVAHPGGTLIARPAQIRNAVRLLVAPGAARAPKIAQLTRALGAGEQLEALRPHSHRQKMA